ncbi:MAG TPA: nickel transporter [Noviherbaspirillum sp.]|nr:nickel transporter [Noviherbaspirillum sp.]
MPEASLAFSSLIAFAALFGLKHGFDADHLASIDGVARLQSQRGEGGLARWAGLLFSLGHGVVMLAAALAFEHLGMGRLPQWLDPLGAWISIFFLGWIGIVNLRNALRPADASPLQSPLVRWVMNLPLPRGAGGGLLVGALFAMSFDAMSVAAWFGFAGSKHPAGTLLLALAFVAGMVLTDAINGLVVASLIRRSQAFVQRAGRVFSMLVACSALMVAAFGLSKLTSEAVEAWADGKELAFGLVVFGTIIGGYLVARRLNQAAPRAANP